MKTVGWDHDLRVDGPDDRRSWGHVAIRFHLRRVDPHPLGHVSGSGCVADKSLRVPGEGLVQCSLSRDENPRGGPEVNRLRAGKQRGQNLKFTLFSIHHSPFSASMLADFSAFRESQGQA
jgi:hypothetical protein